MAKKNLHKFARSSSSLQPRSRLLVRRREERRRHTSLWLTTKDELPLVVLCRVSSRRHHLQAVVLRLQAHVSSLFSLFSLPPGSLPPDLSLLSFLRGRVQREIKKEGREIAGRESRESNEERAERSGVKYWRE